MENPLDTVELRHAVESQADLVADFFRMLTDRGLKRAEALALTQTWIASVMAVGAQQAGEGE